MDIRMMIYMKMWCLCMLLLLMIKNGYGIEVNRVTGSLIEYSFNNYSQKCDQIKEK